jgi:hypothetical protein
MLKKHFTKMQLPGNEPGLELSHRNRAKLLKIEQRVKELRGER